ncbi:MAG: MFS transporter [Alphaproteobacteria bacterium]
MLRMFLSISALLGGVVFLGLANGLFFTLLGVRMSVDGVSEQMIGLVGSAYFAGQLAGTVFCARVIRRVGHIRAFIVFAAVSAIAALLHTLIPVTAVWLLLRGAMGFALAGLFMVSESWLQFQASNETRGRTFALYVLAHTAGIGAGPLLINLAEPVGYELFAISSILFTVALLPVALTRMGSPVLEETGRFGFRELLALSPLAVAGSLVTGLVSSAFAALGPVYATRLGLTTLYISFFMTAMRLGGFFVQYPIGVLSDRFDRRRVMVTLSFAGVAASLAVVGVGAVVPAAILILSLAYGAASQPIYPLVVAHANDYVEPRDFVAASAGLLFAYGIGATLGPIVAAAAMDVTGPSGLFLFTAAVLAGFAAFILYRMRRRSPLPTEQQGAFVPVARNTPTASRLDPRAHAEPTEETARPDEAGGTAT